MYCKECGHKIADDSKFCQRCGKLQDRKVVLNSTNPENSNTDSLQLENKIANKETEKLKQVVTQKTEQENIFGDIEQKKDSPFWLLLPVLLVIILIFAIISSK